MRPLALFDLDDTLVDRRRAFTAWAQEFVAEHRLDGEALTFLHATDARHRGPMDGFFATVCRRFDLAEPPEQLWRRYRQRMPELASCRPEDLDGLRRLRRAGWRIGIVTNGMADNQPGKIRNTGLAALVDGWGISGELGIRKPDPKIFRRAAQRCGARADGGGWMVGDNLELDIAGARTAGPRTIWLRPRDRAASTANPCPEPDVTVESVTEAIDILIESR
jgi:HAD superfamily hydrolase (TIGR01549 family)